MYRQPLLYRLCLLGTERASYPDFINTGAPWYNFKHLSFVNAISTGQPGTDYPTFGPLSYATWLLSRRPQYEIWLKLGLEVISGV